MESKPPTIVSSTTSKGIDRKKANRMVDPKGYFHPKMPMSEDIEPTFVSGENLIKKFGNRSSIMPYAALPEMAKKSVHHWMMVDGENEDYKNQKYGYLEIPTIQLMEILHGQMDDENTPKQQWVDNWMNGAGGLSHGYRYPKGSIWPVIWGHGFEDGSHRLDRYLKMKLSVIPVVVCL